MQRLAPKLWRPGRRAGSADAPVSSRLALALGAVAILAALAFVLSRSPPVVARSNAVAIAAPIATVTGPFEACQRGEVLPRGTDAIRLSLEAMYGPRVTVRVLRGGKLLTEGARSAGWSRQSVTVPVRALPRTEAGVSVCLALAPRDETVYLKGTPGGVARGSPADGRIRLEYLRGGDRSWLTLVPAIARRMSFGHATEGIWIVYAAAGAMALMSAIVTWMVGRSTP